MSERPYFQDMLSLLNIWKLYLHSDWKAGFKVTTEKFLCRMQKVWDAFLGLVCREVNLMQKQSYRRSQEHICKYMCEIVEVWTSVGLKTTLGAEKVMPLPVCSFNSARFLAEALWWLTACAGSSNLLHMNKSSGTVDCGGRLMSKRFRFIQGPHIHMEGGGVSWICLHLSIFLQLNLFCAVEHSSLGWQQNHLCLPRDHGCRLNPVRYRTVTCCVLPGQSLQDNTENTVCLWKNTG